MSDRRVVTSHYFQRYYPGLMMADAMQNSRILSIFECVLKHEAVEGAFQNR